MPCESCASCRGPLFGGDRHILCTVCLGRDHADAALSKGGCPECGKMALSTLRARLASFNEDSVLAALPHLLLGPCRKKCHGQRRPEHVSEPMPDLSPCASLSEPPSPVMFTQDDQHPSQLAAGPVSFRGLEADEDDDDSFSLTASQSERMVWLCRERAFSSRQHLWHQGFPCR